MTHTTQPKALELADWADMADKRYCMPKLHWCADELRRQHAEIADLSAEVEREREARKAAQIRQAELTDEVVRLEPMRQRAADIERLTAEVERLRADAERLDWLSDVALSMDAVADPDNFTVVYFGTDPCKQAYGRTLRIAVDAAREAKG